MSEIKVYRFDVSGGETIDERGKANWPDMVNVHMSRGHAWDLFYSLMMQLRENDDVIYFSYMGQIKEDIETSD